MKQLSQMLAVEKSLVGPISWANDGRIWRFSVLLDEDGAIIQGLNLFGRASCELPDRHVTLGLTYRTPRGIGGNFERIDWRPKDAHTNRGCAPVALRFLSIPGSHRHSLDLNAPSGMLAAMHDNLPVAEPLDEDIQSWAAVTALAGRLWRVAGLEAISVPKWQYDLLPSGGARKTRGMKR